MGPATVRQGLDAALDGSWSPLVLRIREMGKDPTLWCVCVDREKMRMRILLLLHTRTNKEYPGVWGWDPEAESHPHSGFKVENEVSPGISRTDSFPRCRVGQQSQPAALDHLGIQESGWREIWCIHTVLSWGRPQVPGSRLHSRTCVGLSCPS